MRVLFDHCTPYGIARFLVGHEVSPARKLGWAELTNGKLLNAAEEGGFDVMVTVDQNIRYQQNLRGRKIALVVLGRGRWALVQPVIENVIAAVNAAKPEAIPKSPFPSCDAVGATSGRLVTPRLSVASRRGLRGWSERCPAARRRRLRPLKK